MIILHRHTSRGSPRTPFGDDSSFVPLAISLAAFAMSCAVLFGLAMSESDRVLRVAITIAILMIAAMCAVSWHLHRRYWRKLHRFEAHPSAAPSPDAPPAVAVRRFTELRTTACRCEPSSGTAFNVRCFRMDCTSPHGCREKETR